MKREFHKLTDDNRPWYLVITPFFPTPEKFNGPFIYDQVKAIERTGRYRIAVFKPGGYRCASSQEYEYMGVRVRMFPSVQSPSYFMNGITFGLNSWLFVRCFAYWDINVDEIAVVHTHTSNCASMGLSLKRMNHNIILINQHHERDPLCILNGRLSSWLPNLWFRAWTACRLYRKMDWHVSVSRVVDDNLRLFPMASAFEDYPPYLARISKLRWMKHIGNLRTIVLYNGVDTSLFYPKSELKPKSKFFKIGCVGNFIDLKDQMSLIRAVEFLVRERGITMLRLFLLGSGPLLKQCKSYVVDHGLEDFILFEEERDHSLLCDYYNSLDLFVLPSLFEGFGCVFTEAYACGVPFMVCDGQGAAEYIHEADREHWIIPKHDPIGIANKISDYIANRWEFRIVHPISIDTLVTEFLDTIDPQKND